MEVGILLLEKLTGEKDETRLPFLTPTLHKLLYEATSNNVISIAYSVSFLSRLVCQKHKAFPPRLVIVIFFYEEIKKLDGWVFLWVLVTFM